MIRITAAASIVVFVGVGAAMVAYRLSADALALIVGVVLGLIALIPTVALSLLIARRSQRPAEEARPAYAQPPVVVVSGGHPFPMMPQYPAPQQQPYQAQNLLPPPQPAPRRDFRVMGYETVDATDADDGNWSWMR